MDAQHLGVSATTRWPAGDLRRTPLTCHPRIEHGSRRVCSTGRRSASQGYLDVERTFLGSNSCAFAENHPLPPYIAGTRTPPGALWPRLRQWLADVLSPWSGSVGIGIILALTFRVPDLPRVCYDP